MFVYNVTIICSHHSHGTNNFEINKQILKNVSLSIIFLNLNHLLFLYEMKISQGK